MAVRILPARERVKEAGIIFPGGVRLMAAPY